MIVLIRPNVDLWDFMALGIKSRKDVLDIPLNHYCSKINRIFRKYFQSSNLPSRLVLGKRLVDILKGLKSGDKVIVCDYMQPCLFFAIKDLISSDVCVSSWLWNPIKNNNEIVDDIKLLKTLGVKCFTFDSEDARILNLNHLNTFYNMNVGSSKNESSNINYDFYFLGVAKDRGELILKLQDELSFYNNLFIVPSKPSQYITYVDNVKNIKSTRCLVDITQSQQHDITLRPLESIAYKKKLITNNVNIKEYPFYSSSNIFIWGVDKMENIEAFLNSPYEDIEKDVIKKYDINYWLDSMCKM